MPIACVCGKLLPQLSGVSFIHIKSRRPQLCNQCQKTGQLVASINSLSSNTNITISSYSKNGSLSTQWAGSGLSPVDPFCIFSITKIIASGIPANKQTPVYISLDGINAYTPVINILNNSSYEFSETGKIVFNGKVYVTSVRHIDNTSSRMAYSVNGILWLDSRMSVLDTIQDISSDGQRCLAIARNVGPMCSSDGITWSYIEPLMNYNPNNYFSNTLSSGNKWFISACYDGNNCIYVSSDMVKWDLLVNIPSSTKFMKSNGKIILIGYDTSPFMQYSLDDGLSFIDSPSASDVFPSGCNDVAWNGSLWVAVASGINTIATSTDGISWNPLGNSIFTEAGISICWNTSHWLAGGSGTNSMAYSTNGIDWVGAGTHLFTKITTLCSLA